MLWGGSATAIGPQSLVDVGNGPGLSAGLGGGIAVGDADPGPASVDAGNGSRLSAGLGGGIAVGDADSGPASVDADNDPAGAADNEHPTSRHPAKKGRMSDCAGICMFCMLRPHRGLAWRPTGFGGARPCRIRRREKDVDPNRTGPRSSQGHRRARTVCPRSRSADLPSPGRCRHRGRRSCPAPRNAGNRPTR